MSALILYQQYNKGSQFRAGKLFSNPDVHFGWPASRARANHPR